MPDDDNTLRDADGYVYEKNWAGQYEKKWDFGGQDYKRDRSEIEARASEYSYDGTPLYRPRDITSGGSGPGTGTGGEAILAAIAIIAVVLIATVGIAFAFTPIIAPILLIIAESERKKNNLQKAQKYRLWGEITSGIALFAVFGLASSIALTLINGIFSSNQYANSTTATGMVFILLLAIVTGLLVFFLVFVTASSPTAIVFLHYREAHLRIVGNFKTAERLRMLKIAVGTVAAFTVALSIIGVGFLIIVTIGVSLLP